jgi:hypothetical protein
MSLSYGFNERSGSGRKSQVFNIFGKISGFFVLMKLTIRMNKMIIINGQKKRPRYSLKLIKLIFYGFLKIRKTNHPATDSPKTVNGMTIKTPMR